ncbi:MAG: thiol-disulfide oxidoreductase DCC family protein [Acidiferrobacterales bacterium]
MNGRRSHTTSRNHAIVLFDGVCNLCHASVRFIIDRDSEQRFRFGSLQSHSGRRLLQQLGSCATELDSVILIVGNRVYKKSAAALHILRMLGGLWLFLYVFMVVPPAIRDRIYDFVGKRRYRWFGKMDACPAPARNFEYRFLK